MILPKKGKIPCRNIPFFYWLKPINGRQIFGSVRKPGCEQI